MAASGALQRRILPSDVVADKREHPLDIMRVPATDPALSEVERRFVDGLRGAHPSVSLLVGELPPDGDAVPLEAGTNRIQAEKLIHAEQSPLLGG